jgi:hypothetical protein
MVAEMLDSDMWWEFEISPWRNDSESLVNFLLNLKVNGWEMVGFNNIGFDYPVLHYFWKHGNCSAADLYNKAQAIFNAENRFEHVVWPKNRLVNQLDLFKIHHFDNKAKMTSLKALEFNMRMDSVEDLPFEPGTVLAKEQVPVLLKYNRQDVKATKRFCKESLSAIELRRSLSVRYNKDFMNHNDVKIGKEIFQTRLEQNGIETYTYGPNGRKPRQTPRHIINLKDCVPNYIKFKSPEFNRILDHFLTTTINQTKGAFDDLTATCYGLDFDFGTGGLHASVNNKIFESDDEYVIIDADVTSMYPSIAIVNSYYPEHLGARFVEIYDGVKQERLKHKKGTPDNAALKLALNGTFGATNDKFSIFYDPLCTMQITITGQLCLAMLVDYTAEFMDEIQFIQANTDGITVKIRRDDVERFYDLCTIWESITGLDLEYVNYDKMLIADVNSYIAVSDTGKIKRKGRYDYNVQWHQNASKLVVPKVAEKYLLEGGSIPDLLREWPDKMDFMCRAKIPRTSYLLGIGSDGLKRKLPNLSRYYPSPDGMTLTKLMPPLPKKPDQWRNIGVESGWKVCICNDINDATMRIDYRYYEQEVEKLVIGFEDG